MYSLRFRLISLFIFIVTATLAIFGCYRYIRLSDELEKNFNVHQNEVITRLTTSLPSTLWNIDESTANKIIKAEMLSPDISHIAVYFAETPTIAFVQAKKQADQSHTFITHYTSPPFEVRASLLADAVTKKEAETSSQSVLVGTVAISFSHDYIEKLLSESLLVSFLQILILDLVLTIALILSLKVVFDPIQRLQQALAELASNDGELAAELIEPKSLEFGKVIRSFNLVLRNLKLVIQSQREAEALARISAQQAEEAYNNLKIAQKSLVQSEKWASLGSLVAGIAHEINTPVGVIVTSASVLDDATLTINKQVASGAIKKSDITTFLSVAKESARLILSNADRAANLIQSFKQVAVDQTSEQRREFDFEQFLNDVIASLNPTLRKSSVSIEIESQEKLILDSYPGLIAQVITNLTMNAVAHAFPIGSSGKILIQFSLSNNDVHLHFRDNGQGIPEEFLDKIFEPFFTTKRGQGGTGLGLNIVFNIITKQLSGSIKAQNHPDGGAIFHIQIPRITKQSDT